jgi:chlorobactene glucosyltransferase
VAPADFLPALPWLVPFAGLFRLADRRPSLEDVPPVDGPLVSVIVPARNESAVIETVVASVLATRYPRLELIVVDDRSTDDTAARVRRLIVGDARARLVAGAALPEGWYGKPWACVQGARAATGDLLLFTDADTTHGPELLGRAVAALERAPAGLVTVAPHQRCVTLWERLIMPQIWLLLGLRYHPERVTRARRERDAIANGQFILTTRDAYQAVGTHEAVRHEVAEDLALAQAYLRKGRRIQFAFARRFMETRMYHSLPHLIEGWSKNMYLGGRRSFPHEPVRRALVPLLLVSPFLFWLVPPAVALAGLAGAEIGGLLPAAIAAIGLSALFWSLVSLEMEIPAGYGLGYSAGAAMSLYIALRSIWRGARRVEWRGRVYGAEAGREEG